MHMADALISPVVGGAMWAGSAGLIGFSARAMRRHMDDRRVPLMGVMGAFVFAAQMLNFTIPGTGSSGHLAGGLLLAILLGPAAGFITLASILVVQAMFFADGGLLALGCNIANMGIPSCFVAYPLVYRPLAGASPTPLRIALAAILAAVVALQLGALAVVVETTLSGISELPMGTFIVLMLPVHVPIALVEGLVTAGVVTFVWKARPDVLNLSPAEGHRPAAWRPIVIGLLLAAAVLAGVGSWFASRNPDGLEWSIAKAAGQAQPAEPSDGIHAAARGVQERTAILPDYSFTAPPEPASQPAEAQEAASGGWGVPDAGTTFSGLVGGGIVLAAAWLAGWLLRRRIAAKPPSPQ